MVMILLAELRRFGMYIHIGEKSYSLTNEEVCYEISVV